MNRGVFTREEVVNDGREVKDCMKRTWTLGAYSKGSDWMTNTLCIPPDVVCSEDDRKTSCMNLFTLSPEF